MTYSDLLYKLGSIASDMKTSRFQDLLVKYNKKFQH